MNEDQYTDMVFEEHRKKKRVAYLLWLFLGWFGVHRFYAGETKTGIAQLLLTLTGIGFLLVSFWWWLIDAFLIPDMINDHNLDTLRMINRPLSPQPEGERCETGEEPRRIEGELDPRREAMLEDLRQTGYRKERRDEISRLYR